MAESLSKQIQLFIDKTMSKLDGAIPQIRIKTSEQIIDRTPYDTMTPGDGGQAKASWVATIGSEGHSNSSAREKEGFETKNKVEHVAKNNIEDDFYLTSTCPYIEVLEYGEYPDPPSKGTYIKKGSSKDGVSGPGYGKFSSGGHSNKAPNGMVRVVAADFKNIVDDVVKDLK